MIGGCIRDGIRTAARRPGLALLLWAWSLLLGLIAALPAYNWWTVAFSLSPPADSMRDRFDIGVLADLTKYDQVSGFAMLSGALLGIIVLAGVASAFLNGGILEVLATPGDPRSLLHRFFRGGGHFFGRYLRLLVLTVVGALIVSVISTAAVGAATSGLADSEWEPASMVVGLVILLVLALVWTWFLLAQDYARIRVAADDSRRMVRAWFHAMGFVARRVFATYTLGTLFMTASGLLVALWLLYDGNRASGTWGGIVALVLVQQVLLFGRASVRVALVESERIYYVARTLRAEPVVVATLQPDPSGDPTGDVQSPPTSAAEQAPAPGQE
jgi:hypothetical protein